MVKILIMTIQVNFVKLLQLGCFGLDIYLDYELLLELNGILNFIYAQISIAIKE